MTQTQEHTGVEGTPAGGARSSALAHLSGLDGLRAVAVAAVVIFHLDVSLAPGGFIGVDIFFVISGFLITRILTAELVDTGRIRFAAFYLRRARRLLPAVLVLIAVVVIAALVGWRDELATLPGSAISSLFYVTNWWLIADHQSYFVSVGRPPMLQHLWSLAIEEQFYLVWPLMIVGIAGVTGWWRRGRTGGGPETGLPPVRVLPIVGVALVLALGSTLTMTLIARAQDVPYGASTSRVYFGTDTHSMGLFLGAAAGAWTIWRQGRAGARPAPVGGRLAPLLVPELLAIGSFIGLAYAIATVDEYRPTLYQGGFLLIDLLALVVVMVVTRGDSALGRLLDCRPAVWIGRRSYSIYLWHWPVLLVTRPDLDVHGPTALINCARLGLILLLADASYRFVEMPLRARGLTRRARSARADDRDDPVTVTVTGSSGGRSRGPALSNDSRLALGGLMGLLCLLVLLATGSPLFSGFGQSRTVGAVQVLVPTRTAAATVSPGPTGAGAASGSAPASSASSAPSSATAAVAAAAPATSAPASVAASAPVPAAGPAPVANSAAPAPITLSGFGDSVLLGAGQALGGSVKSLTLDAVEGRQANAVFAAVMSAHARNALAPTVLIDTGNNGVISPDQLDSTLSALSDRQRVIMLTDRVPRDWQDPNNQTLRSICARYPNVVLIDWLHASTGHDSWFYEDGYHLNPTGAAAFTALIVAAARQ